MNEAAPALKLHGYPVSNYVNVVRAALIEKNLAYRFAIRGAAQDEAFLSLNPMGKIPVLETEDGPLAETVAIVE
jgi:glutathione S-transferase